MMTSHAHTPQWNPDSTNLQGKRKLVRKIEEFQKSGVKLQYSTEEAKRLLVRVIGRFVKLRVREIGIPLYKFCPKYVFYVSLFQTWPKDQSSSADFLTDLV